MGSLLSIKDRLDALAARKAKPLPTLDALRSGAVEGVLTASEHFRRREEERAAQEAQKSPALERLGAEILSGRTGRTVCRTLWVNPDDSTARYRLQLDHARTGPCPVARDAMHHLIKGAAAEDFEELAPQQVCFLDTETTGLMGGTGTVPFLVGVGWWEATADGWSFHLEQYLIEDFCHEADMLERLLARLAKFRVVVTYNGRTFDVPLLKTRAIMHRFSPRGFNLQHADLLNATRRFWRGVIPSCSLKSIEREILGIDRGPDIDSALIPALFHEMSRTGRIEILEGVLHHNAQDIVSLGALLPYVGAIARDPFGCGLLTRPAEFAQLGKWMEQRRDFDAAARAWARALDLHDGRDATEERVLMQRLAMIHKRRKAWQDALPIWNYLRTGPARKCEKEWLELAKYHERVQRDPAAALELVRRFRRQLEVEADVESLLGPGPSPEVVLIQAEWEKREERLKRKVEKKQRK